ncbi:MAG: hypothetical protein QXQ33_00755 [Nitrososphaerota archaeon]
MLLRLDGGIVSVYAPAKALQIMIDVSNMYWSRELNSLKNSLKEVLMRINEKYADDPERLRGRRIDVAIKTIKPPEDVPEELRILVIPAVPSKVLNRLSTIRKELYDVINEECIVLQRQVVGMKKRNLYFIPAQRIPALLGRVDELNKKIDELNGIIERFKANELHLINEVLTAYSLPIIEDLPHIKYIRIEILPVSVDPEIVYNIIDDKAKRMLGKLIASEAQELAKKYMEKLQSAFLEVESIIKRIRTEKQLQEAREKLKVIRELALSASLTAIKEQVERLIDMLSVDVGRVDKTDVKACSMRIKALLSEL